MLYGGVPSKVQGQDAATTGPDEDRSLVMPLAIPLIAGPGEIVTVVTISTSIADHGMLAAFISAFVVSVVSLVSCQWLGSWLPQLSANTTALLTRLLLATIVTSNDVGRVEEFLEAG